jgi:hypothetical protein
MKAGKYYIGDLCYVMHNEWQEVCDLTLTPNYPNEGVFTLKNGKQFAIFSTAYGDGSYLDQNGREYAVDSGTIGCILVDDLTEEIRYDLANVVDLKTSFKPWSDGGTIHFREVSIDTDWMEADGDDSRFDEDEDESEARPNFYNDDENSLPF